MRKKIFGIVICMLLIFSSTTLALTPFSKDEQQMKQQFFNRTPVPLPTSETWMKTFGGKYYDWGHSVQQTTDGGYIITGSTHSFGAGGGDVWLIKTDSDGVKIWDRTFGGTNEDWGQSVQQTTDGGYIITGITNFSDFVEGDVWLIKTDSDGVKIWDKIFGGKYGDYGSSVHQTTDGGYIIAGYTRGAGYYDVWLIKTDGNGNKIWDKTFGGKGLDMATSVQETTDGDYVISARTTSYGTGDIDGDVWLIKTNSDGNEIWNKTFGGTGFDTGLSLQQTSDGGYIITGLTYSFGAGEGDVWLIKTDSDGSKVWDKTFGGTDKDCGWSVHQTTDGGYIITGYKDESNEKSDAWLIKTDNNGIKVWDRTFGKTDFDKFYSVQQTMDGGYIMTGGTYSFGAGGGDVWLIKTDSEGKSKTTSLNNLWFEWLFHRFPNVFPILRQFGIYSDTQHSTSVCLINEKNDFTVTITKPIEGYFYKNDVKQRENLIDDVRPHIIGPITVEASVTGGEDGIKEVEFFKNDMEELHDTTAPYSWIWDSNLALGENVVKVRAFDNHNNFVEDSVTVLIIQIRNT